MGACRRAWEEGVISYYFINHLFFFIYGDGMGVRKGGGEIWVYVGARGSSFILFARCRRGNELYESWHLECTFSCTLRFVRVHR